MTNRSEDKAKNINLSRKEADLENLEIIWAVLFFYFFIDWCKVSPYTVMYQWRQ